ncbi:MAG: SLOG family protein, partial [Oscillospiraceae bacterium]
MLEDRLHSCCFTGHRTLEPAHRRPLERLLERQIRLLLRDGISIFFAGGALGFDTLAAETVLRLQPEFSHLRLCIVAPCADQNARWPAADFARYERIREAADEYICLSAAYAPGCMSR